MSSRKSRRQSKRATAAQTADERAAHDAAKHAPVPLISGASYDTTRLHKGLDKAVDKQGANREAEVQKALEGAREDEGTSGLASNQLPGHKTVKAEVQLAPGTIVGTGKDKREVGGVVVTELRQVFDPGEDDAGKGSALVPGGDGQAVIGGQSEVLSIETIDGDPPAPKPVPAEDAETGDPGTTTDLEGVDSGAGDQ